MYKLIALAIILHASIGSSNAGRISPWTRDDSFSNVTLNCTANSDPCGGPGPEFGTCCSPGLQCSFRRGIPVCLDPNSNSYIFGFDSDSCDDPYLYKCDEVVQFSGFCCPIGTSCFQAKQGPGNPVKCINAVGVTTRAFPSNTLGYMPSVTPVPGNSRDIIYHPQHAWNVSSPDINCTTSGVVHSTHLVNSSITFNYTGQSIMVHTVSSPNGGVFSLIVDGFNTTSIIDTYSGPGNVIPTCYPRQFPGFLSTPPDYDTHVNHTITLVYIGPSQQTPEGDVIRNPIVQFDAFAIPSFLASPNNVTATAKSSSSGLFEMNFHYKSVFILLMVLDITAALGF